MFSDLVQHCANVVEPGTKGRVPVPSLYESVPIKISSMDVFGIPRTNVSF